MPKKKIRLNEIDDLVKKMDKRAASIYSVFAKGKVKEKFKDTEVYRCYKDQFNNYWNNPTKLNENQQEQLFKIFHDSQVEPRVKEIKKWCKENKVKVEWYTDNSYQFSDIKYYQQYKFYEKLAKENKAQIRDKIFKTFSIKNTEENKNKFDWACNGEGDELKKISLLSSSSLCAFLCFYNVSEERPLKINILNRWAVFTESIFEWENPLFGRPSSIDVVLVGHFTDGKQEKVVYFIESKFSEYIPSDGKDEKDDGSFLVTRKYISKDEPIGSRIYTDENFGYGDKKINLKLELNYEDEKDFRISLMPNQPKQYIEGVKQMISHYIGINNLLNGRKEHNFGKYLDLPKEDTCIYLGTIVYWINKNSSNYIALAGRTTEILSNDLDNAKKKHLADERFQQVLYPKTYQKIFNSETEEGRSNLKNLSRKIKAYYNFK